MCHRKSRKRLLAWVLSSLLLPALFTSYSFADVTLTDSEATQLMSEIQESQKDLAELKEKLQKAETNLESAELQLNDVKSDDEEQKKYYEGRLKEEKKKSTEAKVFAYSASASTLVISIVLLFVLL